MNSRWKQFKTAFLTLTLLSIATVSTQAQRPYRLTDRQVEQIMRNVERHSETFRASLDSSLDQSRIDGTRAEDNINQFVSDFTSASETLRDRFNNRRSVASDVEALLNRASQIDTFMRRNRLTTRAQSDWNILKGDLSQLATAYNVDWSWNNSSGSYPNNSYPGNSYPNTQARPYRITDRQLEVILNRVDTRSSNLRASVDAALDRGPLDGTRREDDINSFMRSFSDATEQLRNRFNSRRSVADDVQNVLDRATQIDDFMLRHRLTPRAQRDWSLLKSDLSELANAYSVTPRWGNTNSFPTSGSSSSTYGYQNRLTGTYQLDASRSDDPHAIVDRATQNLPDDQRQRATDNLMNRLEAPNMIAIEQRGNTVTIASTRAPQITLQADGQERTETMPSGRATRVRATLSGSQLEISSVGDRSRDFTVTFDSVSGGRQLRITRRLSSDRFDQPIVIQSIYNKTTDVAQWNIYEGDNSSPINDNSTASNGGFIIPNGTQLRAVLETNLTTKDAHEGDRFTMTVRDPSQFDGAVIEGYVSGLDRSGRVSGRSQMSLNFETIRLRNGSSYRFAGIIDSIRTANGENVKVDNEGAVKDNDQTQRTVQRAAIGTAVGAIIGAIAGGGKGAAIGAVVGAGAGAGSVYVQGRDDLDLRSGTEVTIRTTGPRQLN